MAVALATTYVAHLLSKFSFLISGDDEGLNTSPTLVLVVVFAMAFVVAKIFATVYETATDTVL